jgi:hypothetical protein
MGRNREKKRETFPALLQEMRVETPIIPILKMMKIQGHTAQKQQRQDWRK